MKNEKKYYLNLKKDVLKYNKALVAVFCIFMVYALIYSICMLDCNCAEGFQNLACDGNCTAEMFTCTNMPTGLLAFFANYNFIIISIFALIAIIILVLQKLTLLKINKLDVADKYYQEEKVEKLSHVVLTLLFGYTGIHKFRTNNKPIAYIYLINFVLFVVTFVLKTFFTETFNKYLMFFCTWKFAVAFILIIITLNVIEAIFSLISLKDEDEKIFA